MNFLKKLSSLFILFTFVFPLHAFDVDELLDGDGLSNGFTHFLRIGIKTDISSFTIEGDAQIAATALVYDMTVLTRNVADMEHTGARTVNPFDVRA